MTKTRCDWVGKSQLYIEYHDTEWGVPCYDNQKLFEFLILEGAQAGLSWITILKKRENYFNAFDGFDIETIANYQNEKIESLLQDSGIVRNKLKINATVTNARIWLAMEQSGIDCSEYLWNFVGGKPVHNTWKKIEDVPASTKTSDAMAKDLKKRGFKFVGTTICYAFMQATGMVNDHLTCCFRYNEVTDEG